MTRTRTRPTEIENGKIYKRGSVADAQKKQDCDPIVAAPLFRIIIGVRATPVTISWDARGGGDSTRDETNCCGC